jgi:hypothetical protein
MSEDFTIKNYFDEVKNKRVLGSKCTNCGKIHIPPRPICDQCQSQLTERIELGGNATLQAFSVVYVPTSKMIEAGFGRENPNCVGIVKMSEGPMLSAEIYGFDLAHPEEIKIGAPVKAKFIERGENVILAFEA